MFIRIFMDMNRKDMLEDLQESLYGLQPGKMIMLITTIIILKYFVC